MTDSIGIKYCYNNSWANSRRWWRTAKPGLLQYMGLQRVRHDLATEQQPSLSRKKKFSHWEDATWKIICWLVGGEAVKMTQNDPKKKKKKGKLDYNLK